MRTSSLKKSPTKKQKEARFSGVGLGVTHDQKPVSVMLPEPMDSIVRAQENRSEFIRQAIAEKIEREGLTVENPIAD